MGPTESERNLMAQWRAIVKQRCADIPRTKHRPTRAEYRNQMHVYGVRLAKMKESHSGKEAAEKVLYFAALDARHEVLLATKVGTDPTPSEEFTPGTGAYRRECAEQALDAALLAWVNAKHA